MKLLLLLLVLTAFMVQAQEPYRQLMITQIYTESPARNFAQITNMGNKTINLKEFKFGNLGLSHPAILDVNVNPFTPQQVLNAFMLPDHLLAPGESFVITNAFDFGPRQYAKHPPAIGANERPKNPDWYKIANILIHQPEANGDATDSVTLRPPEYVDYRAMDTWDGRNAYFLEHHYAEGDSAAIDQFGGVFDDNGRNFTNRAYDVAGVVTATARSIFIRKFKYKTGNLNFASARGLGYDDSEWIVIQRQPDHWRDLWWVHGNQGNYVMDANTLESDIINVDFANKKLTVPWGVRRLDGIMRFMKKKPGIAWWYHLNDIREDSLYRSVRTGDKLEVIVSGNEMTTATFDIVVSPPTADANIVVPKDYANARLPESPLTPITTRTQSGILAWPRVTTNTHGADTIWGSDHGLPYALRTDSLLRRLEKPSNASWEFVWVDGIARPDIKNGDKLKVTAQNGNVKEYYLLVRPYSPSHNARLDAITWPDAPEYLKGIFGWKGDTIPGFNSTTYSYRIEVPLEVSGIPHLIAKAANLNAKIEVVRATSLSAGPEARIVSFIVTAEDDSVQNIYNIELVKEKDPSKIQPFRGEPFLAEWVWWSEWNNQFAEVYNPGNQPLDLSNYMFTQLYGPDNNVSRGGAVADFPNRYQKYVPGYRWVNETQWQVTPGILEPDLAINPILQPGELFTWGWVASTSGFEQLSGRYIYPPMLLMDLNFSYLPGNAILNKYNKQNPWGETINRQGSIIWNPSSYNFQIHKILNDSVKLGLKPATDPNDFQLVENIGNAGTGTWKPWGSTGANFPQRGAIMRKSHIWKPNPVAGNSFGTVPEESEWDVWQYTDWVRWGHPLGLHPNFGVVEDVGRHDMIEPTHYKSTVSSVVYKVSDGYSTRERIRGMKTGGTVEDFLSNIIKANENQILTVKSTANGSVLTGNAVLTLNDTLVVLSSDSINTTKYILEVSADGLNDNAVLTSTLYQITVEVQPVVGNESVVAGSGNISGFEYGTRLRTILNNIVVPMGATMNVINSEGAYVSTKILNFDTAYVDVTVNSGIYLDVLAEDGLTQIVYQLRPTSSESDAFILSDVYTISQSTNLIQFVPRGSSVNTFMSYLVPSTGSAIKLVDKMGHERVDGGIAQDDKVVVTSANGQVTRVYHLSMLRTQYLLASDYLAYILSNVYAIDQVNYAIAGATGTTLLTEFNSNITPAMGATAVVVDANGNERTSGDLNEGDKVKVTSADGQMVVMYSLEFATSAEKPGISSLQVYPNPTSGKVNIQGLELGTRIQVFSQTGALLRDVKNSRTLETISLDNQPSGLYLVVITKDSRLIGQHKVVLK